MEVDEVFERIGEFGPAQVKLFFVLTLPGTWMALHGLVPNFIGTDPGWNCSIRSPTGEHGQSRNRMPELYTGHYEKATKHPMADGFIKTEPLRGHKTWLSPYNISIISIITIPQTLGRTVMWWTWLVHCLKDVEA